MAWDILQGVNEGSCFHGTCSLPPSPAEAVKWPNQLNRWPPDPTRRPLDPLQRGVLHWHLQRCAGDFLVARLRDPLDVERYPGMFDVAMMGESHLKSPTCGWKSAKNCLTPKQKPKSIRHYRNGEEKWRINPIEYKCPTLFDTESGSLGIPSAESVMSFVEPRLHEFSPTRHCPTFHLAPKSESALQCSGCSRFVRQLVACRTKHDCRRGPEDGKTEWKTSLRDTQSGKQIRNFLDLFLGWNCAKRVTETTT